jgi:hypothetical protein
LHQLRRNQLDVHLQQSARRLHANIRRASDPGKDFGDLLCFAIEHLEIIAEDFDHHVRLFAGERLVDSLRKEGVHREVVAREFRESLSEFALDLFHVCTPRALSLT